MHGYSMLGHACACKAFMRSNPHSDCSPSCHSNHTNLLRRHHCLKQSGYTGQDPDPVHHHQGHPKPWREEHLIRWGGQRCHSQPRLIQLNTPFCVISACKGGLGSLCVLCSAEGEPSKARAESASSTPPHAPNPHHLRSASPSALLWGRGAAACGQTPPRCSRTSRRRASGLSPRC